MATIVTDPNKIRSWVKAKQTNEQELLRRLNRAFSHPTAYRKVRKVVCSALLQMIIEARLAKPGPVKGALQDSFREDLAVWQRIPGSPAEFPLDRLGDMLVALYCRPQMFDIGDLSELIRLIGGWIEKGGGFGVDPDKLKKHEALTEAFRPGLPVRGQSQDQAKMLIWDKKRFRQREDRITDPNFYHMIEQHVQRAWIRPHFERPSGLQMFRVNRDDLVRKIDLLFGLLRGATISGTTTDTVLVLEAFGAHILHPGYYLFPVATIAASLHHTLVEAGLALSLVDCIKSYSVGFYTTLTPERGFKGELEGVSKLLMSAEKDMRNRCFVLWYDGDDQTPTGCILFDRPGEKELFKTKLADGKRLLNHVRILPRIPRRNDVAAFVSMLARDLVKDLQL